MKFSLSIIFVSLALSSATYAFAHGMPPELVTVMNIVTFEKCKSDQPSMSDELDEAFSKWHQRNQKYIKMIEAPEKIEEFAEVKDEIRESLDKEGPCSIEDSKTLIQGFQSPKSDIEN